MAYIAYKESIKVEPGPELETGPEEVSLESNPEQVDHDLPESSSAPPEYIPTPGEMHLARQIETLSENDRVIQEQLNKLQGNQYEAVQSAENPMLDFDYSEAWEKLPERVQDAALDILAAIPVFLRGGSGESSEDEQVIRAAVKLMRVETDNRIASRAALLARAMEDPDMSIYAEKGGEKVE